MSGWRAERLNKQTGLIVFKQGEWLCEKQEQEALGIYKSNIRICIEKCLYIILGL